MRLTPRCMDLFRLLRGARWLSTGQIHRRFFRHATLDSCRKRLRKHVAGRYLVTHRAHYMAEAYFALGSEGKRVLQQAGVEEIALERRLPRQIEHFSGINDIRIAFELAQLPVSYFFACWELAALRWQYPVIPDALCALDERTFAIEYDRGMEGVTFFARTKIPMYELDQLPLAAVVVITDGRRRLESLARAVHSSRQRVLFSTLEELRCEGLSAPIFHRAGQDEPIRLI